MNKIKDFLIIALVILFGYFLFKNKSSDLSKENEKLKNENVILQSSRDSLNLANDSLMVNIKEKENSIKDSEVKVAKLEKDINDKNKNIIKLKKDVSVNKQREDSVRSVISNMEESDYHLTLIDEKSLIDSIKAKFPSLLILSNEDSNYVLEISKEDLLKLKRDSELLDLYRVLVGKKDESESFYLKVIDGYETLIDLKNIKIAELIKISEEKSDVIDNLKISLENSNKNSDLCDKQLDNSNKIIKNKESEIKSLKMQRNLIFVITTAVLLLSVF